VQDIHVPDIGSSGKAKIIEVLVKVGDTVEADQSLITLESDKASMEIPSPAPAWSKPCCASWKTKSAPAT
jgi:pyruvate dehydrogenase E2 component (dihydrolipoamide acetyltransferase)